MKVRLNRKRRKQENGISWIDSTIKAVCHNFTPTEVEEGCAGCKEEKEGNTGVHLVSIPVENDICQTKTYIEI